MKKGYIYILTNESFNRQDWVKIGYSENVQRRVQELSNTSVPLPYEIYATYEVPASQGMDKNFHSIIQKLNPELRISDSREFFQITPWDAYDILHSMAVLHGTEDKLWRNTKNKLFSDPEKSEVLGENLEKVLFSSDTYVGKLYIKFKDYLLSKYPDLRPTPTKNYIPFKKGQKHNVVSLWPKANSIEVVLNAKLGTISDTTETIYDISNRLWKSAQYAFRFDENTDMNTVDNLVKQTYDLVKG